MSNVEVYKKLQLSPRLFIKMMWGLEPQVKGQPFEKGKHYSWQQDEILEAVEKALKNEAPRRISIRSGRGIGKSTTLSWLVLWFLFCFKDAQVPCTAPSAEQLNGVLWKEVSRWLQRMPKEIQNKYEWTNTHIRIVESPSTWFATARVARKETPEAISGIHGDNLLLVVDEASAVPDEIFYSAEGTMTQPDTLVILISNPTRLIGYFYETFHAMKDKWQTLHFNAEDSPVAEGDLKEMILSRESADSDDYRVSVLGEFPRADMMDARGYVPLLMEEDLKQINVDKFQGECWMGVDPAGEGDNETVWVIRDNFRARVVAREVTSNAKGIAQKTYTLMEYYEIPDNNVAVDNFGVGANVAKELALISFTNRINVHGVNVGEKPKDDKTFLNIRAESYARLKKWLRSGGELMQDKEWKQLLTLRYRRTESGKMQMMSKLDMRREGIDSPDVADALMLTFVNEVGSRKSTFQYTPNYSKVGYRRSI